MSVNPSYLLREHAMTATLATTRDAAEARIIAWIESTPYLQSPNTRRAYRRDVLEFEAWRKAEGRPFTAGAVEAYAAHLRSRGLAVSTVNRKLSAIRWYARRLKQEAEETPGLAHKEEILRLADAAASVRGLRDNTDAEAKLKGRHVSPDEVTRLLIACENDPTPAGRRDAALIALAYSTGMRRAEIAALEMSDLSEDEDGFIITVRGKGGKRREAYLYNGAARLMRAWLKTRPSGDGRVFLSIRRGGHIVAGSRLSGQAIQDILTKRARQAGVPSLTIHDFRRTLAGDLLDQGVDIATIQKLLGHASPITTARYDRRPRRARQDAIRGRKLPYGA